MFAMPAIDIAKVDTTSQCNTSRHIIKTQGQKVWDGIEPEWDRGGIGIVLWGEVGRWIEESDTFVDTARTCRLEKNKTSLGSGILAEFKCMPTVKQREIKNYFLKPDKNCFALPFV